MGRMSPEAATHYGVVHGEVKDPKMPRFPNCPKCAARDVRVIVHVRLQAERPAGASDSFRCCECNHRWQLALALQH